MKNLSGHRAALTAALLLLTAPCLAQDSILDVGFRAQKTVGLYYENGVSLRYSDARLKPGKLFFGFTYVTSRLGTALASNAIKQDNILFSVGWYLRSQKSVRPFGQINTGFFHADYEAEIFDVLPNSSLILSPEIGATYAFDFPVKVTASAGYNLVTGDGIDGAGTLYPLFAQLTASWSVIR